MNSDGVGTFRAHYGPQNVKGPTEFQRNSRLANTTPREGCHSRFGLIELISFNGYDGKKGPCDCDCSGPGFEGSSKEVGQKLVHAD